jgi:hypothetical protein
MVRNGTEQRADSAGNEAECHNRKRDDFCERDDDQEEPVKEIGEDGPGVGLDEVGQSSSTLDDQFERASIEDV